MGRYSAQQSSPSRRVLAPRAHRPAREGDGQRVAAICIPDPHPKFSSQSASSTFASVQRSRGHGAVALSVYPTRFTSVTPPTFAARRGRRQLRSGAAARCRPQNRRRGDLILADSLLVMLRFQCPGIEAVPVFSRVPSTSSAGSSDRPRSRRRGLPGAPSAASRAVRSAAPSVSRAMAVASGRSGARPVRMSRPRCSR